ncbi:MAG: dihydrolipoyl dehydrogenase [Candidatus Fermentibacteraceae bacterium]
MDRLDLVIVGGGPAGYVPAIRAAQMGRRVAVVEEENVGGTCLNRGCIPTKTLVASSELLSSAREAGRLGLSGKLDFSYPAVAKRRDMVVKRLRKGVEAHLKKLGVRVVRGHGILRGPGAVAVEDEELAADNVLLAPGSRPLIPRPLSAEGVCTSRDVLAWTDLPSSLIVVGGGVIGCEFASIMNAFGVDVTVVEMLDDILPGVDSDVTEVVRRSLVKRGVSFHLGSGASGVSMEGDGAAVTLEDGTELTAESLMVAVGRAPRTDDLGLAEAGVDHGPQGIATDGDHLTNLPGVWCAGDATGRWQLAHAGSAQALAAVDRMFGTGERRVDPDAMPACIFTSPEVATVGPGEEEWRRRGVDVTTGTARYIANGKALGMNRPTGFLKIISRRGDEVVVGVQIVGAGASSLVGEAVVMVSAGLRASDVGRMVHPHPTLSELFMEAGESFGHGAIHG